jgi:hypothetical protein
MLFYRVPDKIMYPHLYDTSCLIRTPIPGNKKGYIRAIVYCVEQLLSSGNNMYDKSYPLLSAAGCGVQHCTQQSLASPLVVCHRPHHDTLLVAPIIVLLFQSGHAQIYKHQSYRAKAITEKFINCIIEVDILLP